MHCPHQTGEEQGAKDMEASKPARVGEQEQAIEEAYRRVLGVVRRGERKEVLKRFQSTAHSTLASVLILPYQKVDGKMTSTFGCLRNLMAGHKVIGSDRS